MDDFNIYDADLRGRGGARMFWPLKRMLRRMLLPIFQRQVDVNTTLARRIAENQQRILALENCLAEREQAIFELFVALRQGGIIPGLNAPGTEPADVGSEPLKSSLCRQAQLQSPVFQAWRVRLKEDQMVMHRKLWEWCYIAQALSERGLLQPGMRALGFAVGTEPLPALFAAAGVNILATDQAEDAAKAQGWAQSNQHAAGLAALNTRALCPPETFAERVRFRPVDMNHVPADLTNFDFVWSSCSFEHLGTLEKGAKFVHRAMQCLRPGGIAVHTTELNCTSDIHTIDNTNANVYRRRDIIEIAYHLLREGHHLELDFSPGTLPLDEVVDNPPYKSEPHLKLQLGPFVSTSLGLIITKKPNDAP